MLQGKSDFFTFLSLLCLKLKSVKKGWFNLKRCIDVNFIKNVYLGHKK